MDHSNHPRVTYFWETLDLKYNLGLMVESHWEGSATNEPTQSYFMEIPIEKKQTVRKCKIFVVK